MYSAFMAFSFKDRDVTDFWSCMSIFSVYRGCQPFSRGSHLMGTISLRIQRRILREQLRESRSAPRSCSVTRQRGYLSNNDLSRHLVGTVGYSDVTLTASILSDISHIARWFDTIWTTPEICIDFAIHLHSFISISKLRQLLYKKNKPFTLATSMKWYSTSGNTWTISCHNMLDIYCCWRPGSITISKLNIKAIVRSILMIFHI